MEGQAAAATPAVPRTASELITETSSLRDWKRRLSDLPFLGITADV
jgi:hypothetical protein